MNIFYIDPSPIKAARMMSQKHVIKMILESGQLLSSAHYLRDQRSDLYRPAFLNHPCTIWTAENSANYTWLYQHFKELATIYYERSGRQHKTWSDLGERLAHLPIHIPDATEMTPTPLVMPKEYWVEGDSIGSYRNYYEAEKLFTDADLS